MRGRGYCASLRVVSEWATRRRRTERTDASSLARVHSARTIARLMTIGRDHLTKSETVTIAAIEQGVPSLVDAREIIADFHAMIRKKDVKELTPWLGRTSQSLVSSFGNGVTKSPSRKG